MRPKESIRGVRARSRGLHQRHIRMSAVALLAAAIAAMGIPGGPVGASDDGADTAVPEEIASLDQELLDTEQDLQDVVHRMRAEVSPHDSAFAGIAIDAATNTVTVYRK